MSMKLPITAFGPPKPEKDITRFFLLKATYKSTKTKNYGDGTKSTIRTCLNNELPYANFTVVEITQADKLNKIKLLNKNKTVIKSRGF